MSEHHDLLDKIAQQYGVPANTIVAVWALESNLGRFTGVRPTISALATLAWDGRRPFFRSELLDALTIVDRGDIEPEHLRGSWAGAMGQVQFMPSSYLKYAQDFDGDGHKDIWTSLSRRLRVDRQLPERERLDARAAVGPRSDRACRGPRCRHARCATSDRRVPRGT